MAIIGLETDRRNPVFELDDFLVWKPQYEKYVATPQGKKTLNKLKNIANNKIFCSIFGEDWELAMSLCIDHYLTLIAYQSKVPAGNTLRDISGGGVHKGIVSSANVGGFSKTIDFSHTMLDDREAFFWNQTPAGADLYALFISKGIPTIFVVTGDTH